jgi:RNA polymerase-binding transcription factor DksA
MTTYAASGNRATSQPTQAQDTTRSEDRRAQELPRVDTAGRGPTADLVALPSTEAAAPTTQATAQAYLLQAEAARQSQLDLLPGTDRDPVMAAYRRTVTQILAEVREALRRAEAGLHGICSLCSGSITPQRLEERPWATTCTWCAARTR